MHTHVRSRTYPLTATQPKEVSTNFVRLNLQKKWRGKVRSTWQSIEAHRPQQRTASLSTIAGEFHAPKPLKHKWGEQQPDDSDGDDRSRRGKGQRGGGGWAGRSGTGRGHGRGRSRGRGGGGGSGSAASLDAVSSSGTDSLHTCMSILKEEEEDAAGEAATVAAAASDKQVVVAERNRGTKAAQRCALSVRACWLAGALAWWWSPCGCLQSE
jgi:hypothetical protein